MWYAVAVIVAVLLVAGVWAYAWQKREECERELRQRCEDSERRIAERDANEAMRWKKAYTNWELDRLIT